MAGSETETELTAHGTARRARLSAEVLAFLLSLAWFGLLVAAYIVLGGRNMVITDALAMVVVALAVFLPVALIWAMDRHVRVDFIFASLPARGRHGVELAGHALFTLPFLWCATPAAWAFAERALASAERSRDGGLVDRWMIKGVIPVALGLLFLVVAIDVLRQSRSLTRGR